MAVDSGTYTPETVQRRQRLADALARQAEQPVTHWAEGLARVLQGGLSGYERTQADREGQTADFDQRKAMVAMLGGDVSGLTAPTQTPTGIERIGRALGFGGGGSQAPQQQASPSPAPAQGQLPAPPAPWASGDGNSVVGRIIGAESGGNPNARNPNSSATGAGQFIDSTWLATIKGARPDLANGKSDAQLLAMRSDPNLSREMTAAYADQNGQALKGAGLPVTPGSTYLAHFAGPQGAVQVMQAPPGASVESILGSKVVAANPFLRGMTAGDLRSWADRKMGGAQGTRVASVQPPTMNDAGPQPPAAVGPSPAPAMGGSLPTFAQSGAPAMPMPPPPAPQPPPMPIQPGSAPNSPPAAAPAGGAASSSPAAPPSMQDPRRFIAGLLANPATAPQGRQMAMQFMASQMKPPEYGFQTTPDGTILRTNPRTGGIEPAYQANLKPTFGVIGKDQFGNEQYGWIDPQSRTTTPGGGTSAQQAQNAPSSFPPAPTGVDPKQWRQKMGEQAATDALPVDPDKVSSLRKEVQQLPSYKNVAQAAPIYRAMMEAAGRDTKAADLNMVYGLGKIMDPTSVVREGEIVMANDTQGIADKLNGFIKGIQGEGRLRPEARAQIMQEAHGRMQSYASMFEQDAGMYRGIAGRSRMNVDDVLPKFGEFKPYEPPAKPAPIPTGPQSKPAAPGTSTGVKWKIVQ